MRSANQNRSILFFILLSILFHLLLLRLGMGLKKENPKLRDEVEVTILKSPYQIADIQPPEKEERPEKAKFLGLYDSRVEKEQVSALPPRPANQRQGEKSVPPAPAQGVQEKEGDGVKLAAKTPERRLVPQGQGDEMLESLPEDFYPDYKTADRTYLNVLRFPKIGYFVRLKKIFKTTFNPVPAIRPYFLTNQVQRGQIEVVLGVSVDPSGNLSELFVINSSGLDLYDKEAVRAIRDSSPFAGPPAELMDKSNHLRMVWTFTVYL